MSVVLLWATIIAYALFFSFITLQKHAAFQTTAFDLGNFDQAVWGSLHGRFLAYTNWDTEGTRLRMHVDPILILVSQFYIFHAAAETLLVFQSFVLAVGALPIFALAHRLFSRVSDEFGAHSSSRVVASSRQLSVELPALVMALVYLLFPALEAANMFDFHPTTLEAPLLAFALYFVETRRHRALFITAILLMACKEDVTLTVAALGLYTMLRTIWNHRQGSRLPRRPPVLAGITLIAISLVWFVIAVYFIIPHFNIQGKSPYLGAYSALGNGPLDILRTLLTDPATVAAVVLIPPKLAYVRNLFTPVLFTSLLAPLALVPALPTLALYLLSHNVNFYTLEKFHYAASLVPTVVVSGIYGVTFLARRLEKRFPRFAPERTVFGMSLLILVATLIYHRGHGFTPLGARFQWYETTPHAQLANEFVRKIPPGVSVSAQSKLNPHLSNRPLVYLFPKTAHADYVLFDASADSWPVHPNDVRRIYEALISGDYGVLDAQDGFVLLKRGEANKTLPDRFYDFARGDEPGWPVDVRFEGKLALRGFDLRQDEAGRTSLVTYWQALRPLDRDYRIYPFYYETVAGHITEDTEKRPLVGLLWHPTSQWRPGETVRLATLPWKVGPESNVGLGVIAGRDWWHDPRLSSDIITGTAVIREAFGGTALRLARLHKGQPQVDARQFALARPPRHEAQARFAEVATLLGYDLSCPDCRRIPSGDALRLIVPASQGKGSTFPVTLYWQAMKQTEDSYTVFVHLLGPDGRLVSQQDGLPLRNTRPTNTWLPGEVIADPYHLALPPGLPAGIYHIEIGLYDAGSGKRVPAFGPAGKRLAGDRVLLSTTVEFGQGSVPPNIGGVGGHDLLLTPDY